MKFAFIPLQFVGGSVWAALKHFLTTSGCVQDPISLTSQWITAAAAGFNSTSTIQKKKCPGSCCTQTPELGEIKSGASGDGQNVDVDKELKHVRRKEILEKQMCPDTSTTCQGPSRLPPPPDTKPMMQMPFATSALDFRAWPAEAYSNSSNRQAGKEGTSQDQNLKYLKMRIQTTRRYPPATIATNKNPSCSFRCDNNSFIVVPGDDRRSRFNTVLRPYEKVPVAFWNLRSFIGHLVMNQDQAEGLSSARNLFTEHNSGAQRESQNGRRKMAGSNI